VSQKNTYDYIFYNNMNNKCPITVIFGILRISLSRFLLSVIRGDWTRVVLFCCILHCCFFELYLVCVFSCTVLFVSINQISQFWTSVQYWWQIHTVHYSIIQYEIEWPLWWRQWWWVNSRAEGNAVHINGCSARVTDTQGMYLPELGAYMDHTLTYIFVHMITDRALSFVY